MSSTFSGYISECQSRINKTLSHLWRSGPQSGTHEKLPPELSRLFGAGDYAVLNGGKRIRPILVYAAAGAIGREDSTALDHAAAAIELVHTYSLIHDDLPAMDDDDLRRGKPSLHMAYDEATAILAGDGLQAKAFELLANTPGLSAEQKIELVRTLSAAAGPHGMVGGQSIDIAAVGTDMQLGQLKYMHDLKTGALIKAALKMGGVIASASSAQLEALDDYGAHIGLAFQVVDDILDVEGDTATLGKTQGKDFDHGKPSYVTILGLDNARVEAERLLEGALSTLEVFGNSADNLRDLSRYIVERKS